MQDRGSARPAPARGRRALLGALVGAAPGAATPPAATPAAAPGVFTYDIDRYLRTDPALRRATEEPLLPCGVEAPAGIAVGRGDRLHVVGGRTLRIAAATPGGPDATLPLDAEARCVAVAPDGAVYVGLATAVQVFDAAGEDLGVWTPLGERAAVTSVAVSGDSVYVADSGARRVWRFDRAGRLLGHIGEPAGAAQADGFVVPSPHFDVLADGEGGVWAVNPGQQRVERYGAAGRRLAAWGRAGMEPGAFCGCCNPTDLARLADGRFVTSEKGLCRVSLYRADGTFDGIVAGPEDFDSGTTGLDLAVRADGRVLVLDPKRKAVRVFRLGPAPAPAGGAQP